MNIKGGDLAGGGYGLKKVGGAPGGPLWGTCIRVEGWQGGRIKERWREWWLK